MALGTADVQLTIAVQTVLAPLGTDQWLIVKATITNEDIVQQTVTVNRVTSGGTLGPTNTVVNAYPIQPNETLALPLSGHAVVQGGTLQAAASVDAKVNLSVTYEINP